MVWFWFKCNKMCNRWFIYLTSSTSCTISRKWTGSFPPSTVYGSTTANFHTSLESIVAMPIAIDIRLIKARCSVNHKTLWKQEEWCNIVVDDRSSSDIGQRKEWCEIFGFDVDNEHDYNAECMNNTASLQGRQQQRQWSELKRWKQREDQDFHSPTMPLTKYSPLLTFQVEISALNADAW